eukprot:COSAG01_NODE_9598_length_2395_cov_1.765244_2_plen_217_part_00
MITEHGRDYDYPVKVGGQRTHQVSVPSPPALVAALGGGVVVAAAAVPPSPPCSPAPWCCSIVCEKNRHRRGIGESQSVLEDRPMGRAPVKKSAASAHAPAASDTTVAPHSEPASGAARADQPKRFCRKWSNWAQSLAMARPTTAASAALSKKPRSDSCGAPKTSVNGARWEGRQGKGGTRGCGRACRVRPTCRKLSRASSSAKRSLRRHRACALVS